MPSKNFRQRRALEEYAEAEALDYWDECNDYDPTNDDDFLNFCSQDEFDCVVENQRPRHAFVIDFQALLQARQNETRTKQQKLVTVQAEPLSIANDEVTESRETSDLIDKHDPDLKMLEATPRVTSIRRSLSYSDLSSPSKRKPLLRVSSLTHVRPREKKLSSDAVSLLSCIQDLLPPGVIGAVVGPSFRASIIVSTQNTTENNTKASMLLTWSVVLPRQASNHGSTGCNLRVIPIAGCGQTVETSWETALHVESQIQTCIDDDWSDTVPLSSSHYQRYLELSHFLASRREDWSRMLGLCAPESMQDHQWHVSKALKQIGVSYAPSWDRFDLFSCYHDQERLNNENPSVDEDEAVNNIKYESNVCLVCFDLITDVDDPVGVSMLSPCGHRTCHACWRSYFKSAADNGQGHVLCPAYKCSTKVGLYDAAHLLFFQPNNDSGDGQDYQPQQLMDAVLHDKLVRFEMERFATCQLKARPCPSPRCSRFLTSQAEDFGQGWSFSRCFCGMNRCATCIPSGGPAHPGIDCKTYQKLRQAIDSGKLDSELQSVKWVMKFSRRCPNCQFAIEKNGGCNHMRCNQCNHYFCWQCGGPGQECNAYYCNKNKNYSEQLPEQDQGMFRLLSQYRRLRQTEGRLKQLHTAIAGHRKDDDSHHMMYLESSLHQVMLWLYSFTSINLLDSIEVQPVSAMQVVTAQLELVVHAIILRKFNTDHLHAPVSTSSKFGETAALAGSMESQKKYQSKRKQQSLIQRHHEKIADVTSFEALQADVELQALCAASQEEFERMAQEAVRAGIRQLWKISMKQGSDERRRPRRRIRLAKDDSIGELNTKAKRTEPWKIGMRSNELSEDQRRRWKRDRARVLQLRQYTMSNLL